MIKIKEKYIVSPRGTKVGVYLNIKEYRRILSLLEELEDIRAYDAAKKNKSSAVSFDQAIREIEKSRP